MVVKKSEYQNQYKACAVKKHQAAYLENLNLRLQRRDREFLHTPICWEELNEEEEKVSCDSCDEEQSKDVKTPTEPETQYQSIAEILSDAKEKAETMRKQRHLDSLIKSSDYSAESIQKKQLNLTDMNRKAPEKEETENVIKKTEKNDPADKSLPLNDFTDDNPKLSKKSTQGGINRRNVTVQAGHVKSDDDRKVSAAKTTNTCRKKGRGTGGLHERKQLSQSSHSLTRLQNTGRYCQPTEMSNSDAFVPPLVYVPRVRRPDRQNQIPRVKSTPVSPEPPLKGRPPFIAYGIGDQEDNLATHRTHNVRSSVDVYPPALRAKTRREEEQHRREKEKIHRAHSAEGLKNKLSFALTQDLRDWESEYRKQFHGHEPKDYEKAIASHAVIPRSSQVRTVHRGGCLLVHVD